MAQCSTGTVNRITPYRRPSVFFENDPVLRLQMSKVTEPFETVCQLKIIRMGFTWLALLLIIADVL